MSIKALAFLLTAAANTTHAAAGSKKRRRAPGYMVSNLTQTNPQIILNSG
jgi:hypothetical protein